MTVWLQELRRAWDSLRRAPGFALTSVGTIALGIASATIVWALTEAVLLEPLPLPDSQRIVALHRVGTDAANLSLPDAGWLRDRLQQFDALSVVAADFALDRVDGDDPARMRAALVESDYFRVVALPPLLGRLLQAGDDRVGAAPVVLLGERYWRSAFAADPGVIGQSMTLSGVSVEIVGVISDQADVAESGTELWAPVPPFAPWAPTSPGSNNFELVARIAADGDFAAARAELATVSAELSRERSNPAKLLDATPWIEFTTASARQGLQLLLAAVMLLLALATANVAALVLVRSTRREGELALRHALGASRRQLLVQLLAEGLLLGAMGGAIGVAIAVAGFGLLRGLMAGALPRLAGADIDASVLLFALAASLLSALVFSGLPAWRVRSARASARSIGIGQQRSETRTLSGLITLEVTLATALLGAAALLAQSFLALTARPLGFDPSAVISAEVVLPESRYDRLEPQTRAFVSMVDALGTKPGVEVAAMVVGPPLSAGQGIGHSLLVDGANLGDANSRYRPFVGDYFGAMGMSLLAGRGVQAGDAQGDRVAWVNQAFARQYLGARDPIGARIAWKPGEASAVSEPQWMRVAGIVSDVRGSSARVDDPPVVYAPYAQREADWIRFGTLVARVNGDPASYREALAHAVRAGDPALPLGEVASMTARSERVLARDRFMLQLVALFALLALLLGIQGVYSVVAFAVEQRRSEMGVRQALGARPTQAMATLMRSTLPAILAGTLIGLGLTVVAGGLLSSVLYAVSANDPVALTFAAAVLVSAALLAAWIPARRAQRIDISRTLQS